MRPTNEQIAAHMGAIFTIMDMLNHSLSWLGEGERSDRAKSCKAAM